MSEETKQSRAVDEALLQEAIVLLKTRGESISQLGCMQLSPPIFNELCYRIIASVSAGGRGIVDVVEWLTGEVPDAPSRAAVYRFAKYLREDYRNAYYSSVRAQIGTALAKAAKDDPVQLQMFLNNHLAEQLADYFMNIGSLADVDVDRLAVMFSGVRSVAQTSMDKKKMDARNAALEMLNEQRQKSIELLEQKLKAIPDRVKAVEAKLKGMQESAKRGEAILPEIYQAIYQELTAIQNDANTEAAHG